MAGSRWFDRPGVKAYCGLWGSGKTLAMAEECLYLQSQGVKVYTNFGFREGEAIETFDDLLSLCAAPGRERRHIAMDELGMLLPARGYRDWPAALNLIFLQGRKFGISFSYSVQDFEMVDSNVRRVTGLVCKCRGHLWKREEIDGFRDRRPRLFTRAWYLGESVGKAKAQRLGLEVRRLPADAASSYDTYALISTAQRVLSAQAEAIARNPSVVVVQGE